jgi:hypothetical protein
MICNFRLEVYSKIDKSTTRSIYIITSNFKNDSLPKKVLDSL